MGRRLIITHGERTTQHEVVDRALVIGRDPGCDIFFVDQKLSRRHARVEPSAVGVTLIDLGSRNGTWVNEQQIEQQVLKPGDQVRVGGLRIAYEEDLPPASVNEPESTLVLDPKAAEDERTMVLAKADETASPESTLMLGGAGAPSFDAPESPFAAIKTGVFPPRVDPELGTQVYRPVGTGETEKAPVVAPMLAPPLLPTASLSPPSDSALGSPPQRPAGSALAGVPSALDALRERARSTPVVWRVAALLFVAGLIAYLVAVLPLLRQAQATVEAESIERGRTLLRFLAAVNEPVLAEKKLQELTTDAVMTEPGVKDALILDVNGRVLTPAIRSNEASETIDGIDKKVADIHSATSGRTKDGDVNFIEPLVEKGRRIGFAVLKYSPRSQDSSAALFLFGLIALAAGAAGAALLLRKLWVSSLERLADSVDVVASSGKVDVQHVDRSQPYPELERLAQSVNRLIDAASTMRGAIPATMAATDVFEPVPKSDLAATVIAPLPQGDLTATQTSPAPRAHENELVLDENFVVTGVHPTTLGILDSTSGEVEGRHLIEAIREQKLLELVLDLVNGLAAHPSTSGQCEIEDTGIVSATAKRRGSDIVVTLIRP